MTPEQKKLRARKAAYSLHARYEGREITAAARAAFLGRFEAQVDLERLLPVEERRRRATYAMKAHMTGLAIASARVRGARRAKILGTFAPSLPKSNTVGKRTTGFTNGTAEASNPGRSNQEAADHDGRPLHTD